MLLKTSNQSTQWSNRIRKQTILAPLLVLLYCLILKGGILDSWRGWYYAFQRTLVEIILAIRLIEIKISDT